MNSTPSTRRLSGSSREKLIRILGLLGSDHSGERDAAGLAAHRLVQQHGLTWRDVVEPPAAEKTPPEAIPWRVTVVRCLERPGSLNRWETRFLRGLPRFPRLSVKQRRILTEIADRVLS